jgi:nitrate reductase gamma subunit
MPMTDTSPFDLFLFVGLPYLALAVLVAGSIVRYRRDRSSYSARSSQFLESRRLLWGSVPFHLGILILLVGHLIPFLAPDLWAALTAREGFLYAVEAIGVAAAVLAAAGLAVLLVRRVTAGRLQPVSGVLDVVVVGLLLAQVAVGLGVALGHRWGAAWSPATTTPYLWSLLTLRPDVSYVAPLPPLVKIHLAGAWVIFLLVPFTRLVHFFSVPLGYLTRPFQKVVWATSRRLEAASVAERRRVEERRYLLKGMVGVGAAGALLALGVAEKLFLFLRGPEMTLEEETDLLRKRLERLEMTAEERELQLERLRSPYIRVARVGELSESQGSYFIDYLMRPALAFRGRDGLPLLISAKCTHLGCTVASGVDARGRLLCPCHVSYFDLASGDPEPGSPAKAPLPKLGWVLRDAEGNVVASRSPAGELVGEPFTDLLESYDVYIARQFEGTSGEVA